MSPAGVKAAAPRAPRPGRRTTSSRWPRRVLGAVGLLVALWLAVSTLWTDALWYANLGATSVFTTMLLTRIGLGVAGFVILAGVPLLAGWAMKGRGALPRVVSRTRNTPSRAVVLVPAVLVGLLGGAAAASRAPLLLAWWHRQPFGVTDPTFGRDVSFFVFSLPWWRFVVGFGGAVVVAAFVASLISAALTGQWSLPGKGAATGATASRRRATLAPHAAAQLSILAALGCVVYGVDRLLQRWSLPVTDNALFTGVAYTDAHARVTSTLVVAIIAFVCAGLFAVNVVWRRWLTPVTAVVLLLVSGLVLSGVYPFLLHTFAVRPSEPDKEAPYVAAHIAATRQAWGIDHVEITDYSAQTKATSGALRADAEALPGIRLMDPAMVGKTFDQLQQVRGYYTFPTLLDVDRYQVDGTSTDVVVAAREIDHNGLPDANWNNVHTVFTHGYGLAAAYGNRRLPGGEPDWVARDIPPTGALTQTESRIYFGELASQYVVVGAKPGAAPLELDTPGGASGGGEKSTTYDGAGGIAIGNPLARLAFATRFGDVNLLLSDRVHADSRILYDRTPAERVAKVAPWLTPDADPYPTMVDGRLTWVVDCYTVSDDYPNARRELLAATTLDQQSQLLGGRHEERSLNYMRNAVKATVDAYDGTVTLYAWDESDPVLGTWRSVYPGMVKERASISPDLLSHLRYPQDLFKMQRQVLGRYHQTNPHTWYNSTDLWVTPEDPVAARSNGKGLRESSYYLTIRWPGEADPVYAATSVFVPNNRSNLAAYLSVVADATRPDYGTMRVLRMSDSQQIDGPGQSFNAMITDPSVAETLRPFLNQGSSAASYGNLLTLPLGGGLLYVTPVFTQREGSGGSSSYPALRFVIVRFGEHVAIGATLQEALDKVFQGDSGASTREHDAPGATPTPTTVPETGPEAVKAALAEAQASFQAADEALRKGDLAGYQAQQEKAKAAVDRAVKAAG